MSRAFWCGVLVLSVVATMGCGEGIQMRVPTGCRAASSAGAEPYTNTGWAREVMHEKTGIEMVFIPAGEFVMGSPESERMDVCITVEPAVGGPAEGRFDNEAPLHRVRITKPFYLGKYEVTQEQWQAVMGTNRSCFRGPRNPVEYVSWNDVNDFCAGTGLRLPTEAEWEYACRAGTTTRFCFGDGDSDLRQYAWHNEMGGHTTQPVGQKKPNAWGLYDMHGNLCEWCQDWYEEGYYARSPQMDPGGPASGEYKVIRGGEWGMAALECRSARRFRNIPPTAAGDHFGFRVAMGLE